MSACSISRNVDDGAKCIQGTYQDSSNLWDGDVILLHKLSYLMQYEQISTAVISYHSVQNKP